MVIRRRNVSEYDPMYFSPLPWWPSSSPLSPDTPTDPLRSPAVRVDSSFSPPITRREQDGWCRSNEESCPSLSHNLDIWYRYPLLHSTSFSYASVPSSPLSIGSLLQNVTLQSSIKLGTAKYSFLPPRFPNHPLLTDRVLGSHSPTLLCFTSTSSKSFISIHTTF